MKLVTSFISKLAKELPMVLTVQTTNNRLLLLRSDNGKLVNIKYCMSLQLTIKPKKLYKGR